MTSAIDFLKEHWLPAALAALAIFVLSATLVVRQRNQRWPAPVLALAGVLAMLALGGLAVHSEYGSWLCIASLAGLFLLVLVMILSGQWSPWLAWIVAAIGVVGV